MVSELIAALALLVSIGSFAYSIRVAKQSDMLKAAQQRTSILNQLVECRYVAQDVRRKIEQFFDLAKEVFPDEKVEGIPELEELELAVRSTYETLNDYSKTISPMRLEEMCHIAISLRKHLDDMNRKWSEWGRRMKNTAIAGQLSNTSLQPTSCRDAAFRG